MGGWCCSRHTNIRGQQVEESSPRQRPMGEAPQEGQGPPETVEPMMMMIMTLFYQCKMVTRTRPNITF